MKTVIAIILAAGSSSRLGEPKQLARLSGERLGGERLLERAVRVASEADCEAVIVVLGSDADRIESACDLKMARVVRNEAWVEGMSSSIRAGIAALDPGVEGAIVMTCDQPAVTPVHLRRLLASTVAVASTYAGSRGVPAYFPASDFEQLLLLSGDAGARRLLASAPAVELAGGELDVDTMEALSEARAIYSWVPEQL